ncbi:MAG: DUF5615 family PIN-like protein [Akkermansiaceae bacterium]|nr:DUF5615 family PIN-like protein [Verrucomicrobiales bacterium]
MRILLDECSPRPLCGALFKHAVSTVDAAGFKGLENGDLLQAAEDRFDLLITADKNLRYQQNLSGRKIAVIELPFNSWPRLKPMVATLEAAIESIQPGDYVELRPPPSQ